jgi:hypothetical protein
MKGKRFVFGRWNEVPGRKLMGLKKLKPNGPVSVALRAKHQISDCEDCVELDVRLTVGGKSQVVECEEVINEHVAWVLALSLGKEKLRITKSLLDQIGGVVTRGTKSLSLYYRDDLKLQPFIEALIRMRVQDLGIFEAKFDASKFSLQEEF